MKKTYIVILGLIVIFNFKTKAQEVEISPTLFSSKEFKVSFDLGMDLNWANKEGETSLMQLKGMTTNENIKFNTIPSVSAGLGVDVYSSFSIIGFYFGAFYNRQEFSVHNDFNSTIDSARTKNIDVPIYVKLRFGKVKSKGHLWVAAGAGYSIPLNTELKSFNNNIIINESKDEKLFKATPFLASIIGYEILIPTAKSKGRDIYNRDDFRILLYAKGQYDLDNRINPDFAYNNRTSISQINNADLQFFQISFGIKILMRLSKLGAISKDALIQQLNNN